MLYKMEFRFVNPAPKGCQFYLQATNTPDHDVDITLTDGGEYELFVAGNRGRKWKRGFFSASFSDFKSAVLEAERHATITISFKGEN
jgi:hypothetical protein